MTTPTPDPTYMTPALARWRQHTDVPVLVIAIGTLPILLLELIEHRLSYGDQLFIDVVNVIVFLTFLVDFVVELTVCKNKTTYLKNEWGNLLIVIAQALALFPFFGLIGLVRGARGLRIATMTVRFLAIGSAARRETKNTLRQHMTGFAFGIAGMTWITSAVAFTLAEDVGKGHRVNSFFDALWWSSSTITTVGYGDVYPVTTTGRIIAVFTMIVGVSTFAVVTAKIAEFLLEDHSNAHNTELASEE